MLNRKIKSVVIVEHEANDVGPGHILENYFLQNGVKRLIYIGHPNLYIKKGFERSSRAVLHRFKKQDMNWSVRLWKLPECILYIKDIVYTLFWIIREEEKYDIYIGLGNINALCGVLLKKIGRVEKVIYYVIDYIPNRFENPILNMLYRYAERFAALWSDNTWNLSSRMIEARIKQWNKNFSNQHVVPHGLYFDKKKIIPYEDIHKHELIYMGNLNEEQGVQLVIESIPFLRKIIPDIKFTIIGTGNYEKELRRLSTKLRTDNHVTFLGSIPDNQEMERRLGYAAIAVAMYTPNHKFSFYSDPGKIKHYLSVGLPIIMTSFPQIAEDIKCHRCGEVIPYNRDIFIKIITDILKNNTKLEFMKNRAILLAKRFEWNTIFNKALLQL